MQDLYIPFDTEFYVIRTEHRSKSRLSALLTQASPNVVIRSDFPPCGFDL